MNVRITVLGSGSGGNATLIETAGFGALIDCGFTHRELASRLHAIGRTWADVHAVLLSHTHSDHWKRLTLGHLRSKNIPLYLHDGHRIDLNGCPEYVSLHAAGLIRNYTEDSFEFGPLAVRALEVPHDSHPTVAFRIDGDGWSYGHASDLGCARAALFEFLTDVDVLALEFNHDVPMQRNSPRPRFLIDRVLSDHGHLSNEQAAEVLDEVIRRSRNRMLRAVIQLHLSRECNTANLARAAAMDVLKRHEMETTLVTSDQHQPTRSITRGEVRSASALF